MDTREKRRSGNSWRHAQSWLPRHAGLHAAHDHGIPSLERDDDDFGYFGGSGRSVVVVLAYGMHLFFLIASAHRRNCRLCYKIHRREYVKTNHTWTMRGVYHPLLTCTTAQNKKLQTTKSFNNMDASNS
jgi:hypothetical protein